MILEIFLIIVGFVFLIYGADLLVKAATSLSKKLGLSELIIGLTVVAIGTSLPEVFITITSTIDGHSDLVIGNSLGSSICNFLLVMGITGLVKPVKLEKQTIRKHLPIVFLSTILILIFGNTNNGTVTRLQGIVLIIYIIAYIIYTIYDEIKTKNKKHNEEIIQDVKTKESSSILRIIVYTILGILGLKFGSEFVVDNSVLIAERIGLSEQFIAIALVSIGTSLPEIITGITAARKNETDLLLGNVLGSNIFNLCLLVGIGSIIKPLSYSINFNVSVLILIAITLFLYFMVIKKKKNYINRKTGVVLIMVYIGYLCVYGLQ